MSLVLTEEQQLLRDTATQFFQERLPVANLRKLRDTKDATGFDRAAWKEMTDLGFAGILISEKYGGTEFGPVGLGLNAAGIDRASLRLGRATCRQCNAAPGNPLRHRGGRAHHGAGA
jgi:alkylation response protein AidB-like acyl-CoA dehydrogenase